MTCSNRGRVLDKACLWDSVGDHLFQGEDGKFYIMTFEAHVGEASMTDASADPTGDGWA